MNIKTARDKLNKILEIPATATDNRELTDFFTRLGYGDDELFHRLLKSLPVDMLKDIHDKLSNSRLTITDRNADHFENDRLELTFTIMANKEYMPIEERPDIEVQKIKCVLLLLVLDYVIQEVDETITKKVSAEEEGPKAYYLHRPNA